MAETNLSWEMVQKLLSQQQQQFMAQMAEMRKMNPLDQKKYDEELKQDKRRLNMMVALGKEEAKAQAMKRDSCSHMVYPAGHRMAGRSAPKGSSGAEWITGGQAYQNGTAGLFCLRCAMVWLFRPSADVYAGILQNGLTGEAPPPPEQQVCGGCLELTSACKCDEIVKQEMDSRELAATV